MSTRRTDVHFLSHFCQQQLGRRPLDADPSRRGQPDSALAVEAILFDTDNVLFDDTAWWRWLIQLLSQLGIHTHYLVFYHAWRRDYAVPIVSGQIDFWQSLRIYLRSLGLNEAQLHELIAASQYRREELAGSRRPLPDVIPTLAQLAAREIRLGIVSSSIEPLRNVELLLQRAGLANFFQLITSAGGTDVAKTNQDVYRSVAEQLASSPARVAYVGYDAKELDAAGRAKLITLACRESRSSTASVAISQLSDLPDTVSSKSACRRAG